MFIFYESKGGEYRRSFYFFSFLYTTHLYTTHLYIRIRFCKRHRENQCKDLDYAVRVLPDKIKKGTDLAIIFLVRRLLERCEELRTCRDRSIQDEEEELCYVRFLTEICGVCAGFRRILVRSHSFTPNFIETSTELNNQTNKRYVFYCERVKPSNRHFS